MVRFRSYRHKLQLALVALGLTAIAVTAWETSRGAAAALRQATYGRLSAIRETRVRQIGRYFRDVTNHVLALAADDSTIVAIEEFRAGWRLLPESHEDSSGAEQLRGHYRDGWAARAVPRTDPAEIDRWFPADGRTRTLQSIFIARNPHPVHGKDLLVSAAEAGAWGRAHARFHPTFHRYRSAFGFYDVILIDGDGRVLYTVLKEIDLGADLNAEPYRDSPLAKVFRKAVRVEETEDVGVEDYAPYVASYYAPAAFVAAPVKRAGMPSGVLAIQLSIDDVNQLMIGTGDRSLEGLGESGQVYLIGRDGTLRSDPRFEIEHPEEYLADLAAAGATPGELERVRRYGTAVLNVRVGDAAATSLLVGLPNTEEGVDFRGRPVLRSHGPLESPKLGWTLVAEMETREAFAPLRALERRFLMIALAVAAALLLAAHWLANSVTRPVLALARSARQLGEGAFGTRVGVETGDEIGQLAASFNRMAKDLEKTTVSKKELEVLAGRLIDAQENERSRLARELHDDFSQRLAAAAIEAGTLAQRAGGGEFRAGLERVRGALAGLSDDIHGLSWRLHPATLEDLGLAAAIESECRSFFERGGAAVDFTCGELPEPLPRETTLALFRIVQESLRNIERHAGADEVAVRLSAAAGGVDLEIRDNGQGFDRSTPGWRAGLGLASMEERVRLLGGRLRVESKPGAGTTIAVTLLLAGEAER
ncbi:MAG: HAMP domain-containing protein [Bryobacteraceae bacterium]